VRNKKGEYIWVLVRGVAVRNSMGKPYRMAGTFADITELKMANEQLAHNALHDTLTGLPNRVLFLDRLSQLILRAKRNITYQYATFYLDFDHFKAVNDSMGHQMGDLLLQAIGDRLRSSLRSVDTLARLGGDEFIILVDEVQSLKQVQQVADRIFFELEKPYRIDGRELVITASMGIVMGSEDYKRPEDVLRDVDTAMYQAKQEGRGRYLIFTKQMRDKGVDRLEMEMALRGAIDRQEFVLNYQPILDGETEAVMGFEALVRWQHPEKGIIAPVHFIPLAEETGLIIPLGKWIFREACRQLNDWKLRFPACENYKMAINLSPKQFTDPGFINFVIRSLSEANVSPADIYLEITESVFIDNPEIRDALTQLRDCGLKIQIDDFGTGYSSLSYLHQLPIDALKIDKSFVTQLGTTVLVANGMTGPEIVRTIIKLAKTLKMHVVGEGVETQMQLRLLKELGCDYMQGFLFYKPMEPELVEATLFTKSNRSIASPVINLS
jgi:diguanylate cyclase (GGDEF)-like protein